MPTLLLSAATRLCTANDVAKRASARWGFRCCQFEERTIAIWHLGIRHNGAHVVGAVLAGPRTTGAKQGDWHQLNPNRAGGDDGRGSGGGGSADVRLLLSGPASIDPRNKSGRRGPYGTPSQSHSFQARQGIPTLGWLPTGARSVHKGEG